MAEKSPRFLQLDGWRAFAVLGVMWQHWTPPEWRGSLPFEIGLFYFLTLSGFLITRGLLGVRGKGEAAGVVWRQRAMGDYYRRRAQRLLLPAYVAMVFALLAGVPDLREHPWPYLLQLQNFHMAVMAEYPAGTAHYWSLALQIQFYLACPLLVLFAPRRAMVPLLLLAAAVAPLTRWVLLHHFPQIHHPGALPPGSADYFAAGALLAVALERGMVPGDRRLGRAAWACFAVYLVLYFFDRAGQPVPGLRHIQQTLVAVAFAGLISASIHGFSGPGGRVLSHPAVQNLGTLGYGLYLFHATMPMALGKVAPFLWLPFFEQGVGFVFRLIVFFAASWGAAWLSWRYLETPFDRFRRPPRAA